MTNTTDIAKADRFITELRSQGADEMAAKFYKLAAQAMTRNDFRVCNMVYVWAEFEQGK
jgi:hypothetical protein